MKKDSFDLFVDEVSTYITGLFDCTRSEMTIDSKISDSLIAFNFGSDISELSCFQTVKTICTNIGRRYGFKPIAHSLGAVNNTLVYVIQMRLL